MSLNFNAIPPKRLSQSISETDTEFKLQDILSWDRETDLAPSDFGTIGYGVFRNDSNTKLEIFEFDPSTINDEKVTMNKRGLHYNGSLTNEVADYKLPWTKGSTIVELGSNPGQVLQWLKEYIDNGLNAGASDASESVKGIIELATDSEIENGSTSGSTGARLVVPADSDYLRKQIQRQVTSESSSATPTINTDNADVHRITGLSTDITDMSANLSGTPDIWDKLVIEITGTGTYSITWGSSFTDPGAYNLPTSVDTDPLKVIFNWNGSKWALIGVS